jgi:hypothetical protein
MTLLLARDPFSARDRITLLDGRNICVLESGCGPKSPDENGTIRIPIPILVFRYRAQTPPGWWEHAKTQLLPSFGSAYFQRVLASLLERLRPRGTGNLRLRFLLQCAPFEISHRAKPTERQSARHPQNGTFVRAFSMLKTAEEELDTADHACASEERRADSLGSNTTN